MHRWSHLVQWETRTGLTVVRPPGPPESWTTLLDVLGPYRCLATRPVDVPLVDDATLGAWLVALGRPVHPAESRALWLVSPIPSSPEPERVLVQLLGHPDATVRAGAARTLAWGTHGAAVSGLQRTLGGPTPEERVEAVLGLGRLGGAEQVVTLLGPDDTASVDGARLEALGGIASRLGWSCVDAHLDGPGRVRELLRCLRSHGDLEARAGALDEELRRGIHLALAAVPDRAAELAPALARGLERSVSVDSELGRIEALGASGEEGVELAAELLGHEAWQVRTAAALALQVAGPAAAQVDSALRRALVDEDADVQREAALARQLAGADPSHESLSRRVARTHGFVERVRRLGGSLGAFDAVVYDRPASLELLARLGAPQDPVVAFVAALWLGATCPEAGATLARMAVDPHRRVVLPLRRGAAGGALLACRGEGVVHRLLLAHDPRRPGPGVCLAGLEEHLDELAALTLTDPDAVVRWSAVQAIRMRTDGLQGVLARVSELDPVEEVRREARQGLAALWRATDPPSALAMVLQPDPDLAGAGGPQLLALALTRPAIAGAAARGLLDHDQRSLAVAAARVVGQLAEGDEAEAVARDASRRLVDPAWQVREVGAELLGALGARLPQSLLEEALELLETVSREDADDDVRGAAQRACRAHAGRAEDRWV